MRAFIRSQENWASVAVFSVFTLFFSKNGLFSPSKVKKHAECVWWPNNLQWYRWGTLMNQMIQLLQFPGRLLDLLHQPNSTHLLSASRCLNHHTPIMSAPLICTHSCVSFLVFLLDFLNLFFIPWFPSLYKTLFMFYSLVSCQHWVPKKSSYPNMMSEYSEYNMHFN